MNNLITLFKTQMNLGLIIVILLSVFSLVEIRASNDNSEQMLKVATTEYPFYVIAHGLKDTNDSGEIITKIREWREKEWGAQIGAMNVVCEIYPDRLATIMEPSTAIRACRISG